MNNQLAFRVVILLVTLGDSFLICMLRPFPLPTVLALA